MKRNVGGRAEVKFFLQVSINYGISSCFLEKHRKFCVVSFSRGGKLLFWSSFEYSNSIMGFYAFKITHRRIISVEVSTSRVKSVKFLLG